MSEKAQYHTKQMELLISYLESVRGQHVTVSDIKTYFESHGITIGKTTIYRHLEKMGEQGKVIKYVVDGTVSACFEYIGQNEKSDYPVYYHCKCEKCGRLIHLQCNEVSNLGIHLLEHHGFKVNSLRTVFYGECEECRKSIN